MKRLGWIVVAAALACGSALGQEPRRVELTLEGGETVTGTLAGYGDGRWVVRGADGQERAIPEGRVRSVSFLAEEAAAGVAAVLEAGVAGGRLEALLGDHHFRLRRTRVQEDGSERLGADVLVRVEVRREGGELSCSTQVVASPDEAKTRLREVLGFGTRVPYRFETRLALEGARFLGSRSWGVDERVSVEPGEHGLRVEEFELRGAGGGKGELEWEPSVADEVDEVALYLIVAPLAAAAESPPLGLRVIRPKGPDSTNRVTRLLCLPPLEGRARVELRERFGGSEDPSRRSLAFDPQGRLQELVALDYAQEALGGDSRYVLARRVRLTRISPEEHAAQLERWGGEPELPQPEVGAFAARRPAAGEVDYDAALLQALRAEPSRWYRATSGGAHVLRLRARATDGGAELEVEGHEVGAPEPTRGRFVFDDQGRLVEVQSELPGLMRKRTTELRFSPGGLESRTRSARGHEPPDEEWRREPLQVPPRSLAAMVLAPPALRGGAAEVALLGPTSAAAQRYTLELRAVADGRTVWPGAAVAAPDDLAPTYAVGALRDSGAPGVPECILWIGEQGLLGWSEGVSEWNARELLEEAQGRLLRYPVQFRPCSEAEARAALADADAIQAYAERHHEELEGVAGYLLHDVGLAQEAYRRRSGSDGFAPSYAALAEAGLVPASNERYGAYVLEVVRAKDAPQTRWAVIARPLAEGWAWHALDQRGKVVTSREPIVVGPDARLPAGLQPLR